MIALPACRRQPLQLFGRYCGGTLVPSPALPQRHCLIAAPPPVGRLPVLSSGASVMSWKSTLRSPTPRTDAVITPMSSVVIVSTYRDMLLPSQPQFPEPGGSPPD